MARPLSAQADPVATAERILAAAELEFAARGFAAARLEDVAAAAGIRRPSLLYHFASKDELYEATIRRLFERLAAALSAAMAEGAVEQRFEAVIRAFDRFLVGNSQFASLLLRELLDGRGPGRAILRSQLVPLLDELEGYLGRRHELPGSVSVRVLVLQIASGMVLRSVAGPLRKPLWGDADDPLVLVRTMLLASPREAS